MIHIDITLNLLKGLKVDKEALEFLRLDLNHPQMEFRSAVDEDIML